MRIVILRMQPGSAIVEAPTASNLSLSPADAWEPLPQTEWSEPAARHLLRRAGWSATRDQVSKAVQEGLPSTLQKLFPALPNVFPRPDAIAALQENSEAFSERLKAASPEEKRALQKESRDRSQQALNDMALRWLQFAADPANAALEKWVLFLSDVYVVSFEKVRNASLIHLHHDILRRHCMGTASALTKAISRSPAMIQYLDLQDSRRTAPNENFARELFELFVLGEGHYTERDIKEAARAFTGYRQRFGEFRFARNQHDAGRKTVFGETAAFDGDGVIDLAYRQPAAASFLPREMIRGYLSELPLPDAYLTALGDWWRREQFDLRALVHRFFGSRLFHEPTFRAGMIKSPVQFYLGLLQDLQLDVAPVARRVLGSLRQMGQSLYAPPNVRGWVGGRAWINSATLSARRQLVQALFTPLNEAALNADEQAALASARSQGRTRFSVDASRFGELTKRAPDELADEWVHTLLPLDPGPGFRSRLGEALRPALAAAQPRQLENVAAVLLQSPPYQLC